MKPTIVILICMVWSCVIIADWYRHAEACQPGTDAEGQIVKPREPRIKTTHKKGREIFAKLQRIIGRKPFEGN